MNLKSFCLFEISSNSSDYHTDAGAAGLLKRMLEKYDRRLRPNLTGISQIIVWYDPALYKY